MIKVVAHLHRHDERLLHYVVERRHPPLDQAMTLATRLGDPSIVISVALILMLIPEARAAGASAALVLALSHGAVQVLKRTVNRPRPALPPGIATLLQAPDRFSFPSGHAAAPLSIALGVFAFLPPEFATLLVLISMVTGMSRCYLGVHYPGDVAAGWSLAMLAYAAVSII